MPKKFVLAALIVTLSCVSVWPRSGQVPGGVPADAPTISREVRDQTFEIVWRTVKEKHFDPTLGGLDWDKVRDQYQPRAVAAKSDSEYYGILRQMLGELHQSHFNIIPPDAVVDDDSPEPKGGGIGIDLRLVDGLPTITRVDSGSRAEAAGLRPGFVIKKVDEASVEQVLSLYAKSTESQAIRNLRITRAFLARIDGEPETTVRITYLDKVDQSHEVAITRVRLKGEMSQRFGNFPPQYTVFEARRLADGIGYIRFNIFVILLMERIRGAIREMSDAPGIIFDLRGNPGGLGGMAPGIAGLLEAQQGSLGTMKLRTTENKFAFFPQAKPYLGPVVILTDGGSASTSEVFAAGMQEIGRASVIGERTAGAALPSLFQKLPTGALFQFAIGDFRTPKGTLIEGRGVIPDVEVKLTRRALLDGEDPQLEAAIQQIRKLAKERKAATAGSTLR